MNISYNWLKEYVDFDLTAEEVASILTSIGLETGGVEEVQTVKGGLEGLVIGEVLTCENHPNSDHLHVTTVDLGDGQPTQIVCGAPNVAAGQKVVVAPLGSVLYDGDKPIKMKKMKLRGVESNGMICAEDEIGIGSSHDGIIVLPAEAKAGTPAKDYYNIKSDYVLEVDITPNRADACSHYGVARDLYAYLRSHGIPTALKKPSTEAFKVDNHDLDIDVVVENTEACPRYTGVSVKGVTVKESPSWLKEHLSAIGLRPINNIVDITNYILHAFGQPLHCFDAGVVGKKVIVKTLPDGTPFTTLDGVERKLDERDLMICNEAGPMCIGGVFGGLESGVTEKTTDIFLESAYFHPTWIRKTARRHGLNTDASFRYERGIDPLSQVYALKIAAMLVKELAGGTISSEIKDICEKPAEPFIVTLPYAQVDSLIGKEIPHETIKSIVESLEMNILEEKEGESLTLAVPPYRVDVQRPCDVIEDILRIYGYNNIEIPTALKSSLTVKTNIDRSYKLQNILSEQLVGCGFYEIMNNSLTSASYYETLSSYPKENLVMLLNPLSSDLNAMRQTLLFGGLESIAHNINRKNGNLRFFEIGNTYFFHAEERKEGKILSPYSEEMHMGLWITGKKTANSWIHPNEESSIYELKAYVENLLTRAGLDLHKLSVAHKNTSDLFNAQLDYCLPNGKLVAQIGIVNYKLLKAFDIEQDVYYADIYWNRLTRSVQNEKISYKELSRFPSVKRDLALLLDASTDFAEIEKIAYETERKLLKDVWLFDVYEGKNLEAGKKSYAVSFLLEDENQTLTEKQIEKVMQRLIQAFQTKLGAQLR